uniref:WAP domain-containing protein n=1 Tax=Nothobranchius furzeri TaxID=105023 RepID=A0A8C6Q401_NOTFU
CISGCKNFLLIASFSPLFTMLDTKKGKPGECPVIFDTFDQAQKCHHDRDCPGNEKCCTYYHESVCAPPVSSKSELLHIQHFTPVGSLLDSK